MIYNKNIQIDAIETKQASTGNTKYILTSGKEKFQFWTTHKNQDSDVYQSFKGMQPRNGDTVAIGYTEEEKTFVNNKGETVKYVERNIVNLREAGQGDVPASSPAPAPKTAPRPSQSTTEAPKEPMESREAYGKRLAIHGMVNALLTTGKSPYDVGTQLGELISLENEIERVLQGGEPIGSTPVIQQKEEIDLDSIPF